ICVASAFIFMVPILVLCRSLAFLWDKRIYSKCGSLNLTYLIRVIVITIEDITILALPMQMLWKLQVATKKKKKIGAIFISSISLGICLVYGVRLKYVLRLNQDNIMASIRMFVILGTMEPMLGIICACLPVLSAICTQGFQRAVLRSVQSEP
ncbi:uncharacterized protein BDR25DRAFT_240717, partial [Lindgomyces ingoldianus]